MIFSQLSGNWEPLGGAEVFVTKEHRFNTDTLLLANFSMPKNGENAADFGTGCGTIALIWAARTQAQTITAVELQEQAYIQALESVKKSGFDDRIDVIQDNIQNYREIFQDKKLDLIACNPPYKALGAGLRNKNKNLERARHETELSLEDLAKAAAFTLRFGGRLCICQRPERLADAICIFREKGLEAKQLRLVQGRKDKSPSLFLLECRLGGKPGLSILPTLNIQENGEYTPEMMEIYGDYRGEMHG